MWSKIVNERGTGRVPVARTALLTTLRLVFEILCFTLYHNHHRNLSSAQQRPERAHIGNLFQAPERGAKAARALVPKHWRH